MKDHLPFDERRQCDEEVKTIVELMKKREDLRIDFDTEFTVYRTDRSPYGRRYWAVGVRLDPENEKLFVIAAATSTKTQEFPANQLNVIGTHRLLRYVNEKYSK